MVLHAVYSACSFYKPASSWMEIFKTAKNLISKGIYSFAQYVYMSYGTCDSDLAFLLANCKFGWRLEYGWKWLDFGLFSWLGYGVGLYLNCGLSERDFTGASGAGLVLGLENGGLGIWVEYCGSEDTIGFGDFFTRTQFFVKRREGPLQGTVGGRPVFLLKVDFSFGFLNSLVGRNGCL